MATKKNNEQSKLIEKLKKKEHWMKWAIIAALIIILLLLLFVGYATDWMSGLNKNATTPLSTQLDTTSTQNGASPTPTSGGSTTTTTNPGSSTTTNTSTTNNTTTTSQPPPTSQPPSNLKILLDELNAGDNIQTAINRANELGVGVDCTDNLLVKECTFRSGNETISTKSILGTGMITSVLPSF